MSKPNEKTTQAEAHALVWDRLMQSQGILGALQAADKGDDFDLDPFVLSNALWAVQELLSQCIEAHEAFQPLATAQSEVEA